MALLLLMATIGVFGLRAAYGGKIYPAITVAGIQLGGESQEEARLLLAQMADDIEQGSVTFTYQDQVFSPTLAELGVSIDIEASLAKAYGLGREDDATERLKTIRDAVRADHVSPLYATFDRAVLDQWFDETDARLGLPPHNAYIEVIGTDVRIVPEVDGVVVDREMAAQRIFYAVDTLSTIAEPLPTVTKRASVRADHLNDVQLSVEEALSKPVKVTFEGEVWEIPPADLGAFVVQHDDRSKSGAAAVSVGLDMERLIPWLTERFESQVNRDPTNAVVGWNQGLVALEPSIDGIRLRQTNFAEAVEESFFGQHRTVLIPVNVITPDVDSDNLAALGITTELSRGDSNYDGSTYEREVNIGVGASLLNGTLIPPHGTFSFNHSIGEITEEKGYVEAKVIVAERIGQDIGGGICQVSTTVFRAALLAGLPIVEWNPHSYRIAYYERDGWGPGYDASILQPEGDPFGGGDFRFQNPSDSWMLVESWVDGSHVVVKIYGADLNREAQFSETELGKTIAPDPDLEVVDPDLEPGTIKHTELPEEGVEVWFTRDIFDGEGNLIESRKFYTVYHSRGNVWQVSPDMKGQSPASLNR
jgi:vancomycin resistance protein YoaR